MKISLPPTLRLHRLAIGAMLAGTAMAGFIPEASAEHLVILHTNDTHSQVDPVEGKNLGGVMRRKALIDSVRAAEKNVLLVDAGDAVQGSLYFYLYGGKAEQELMNIMGVDLSILGNHDFDNGIDSLGKIWPLNRSEKLATNYFLERSALKGLTKPYTVKTFDGRRIGFIGLNIDPKGLISDGNYDGLEYTDYIEAANLAARYLKEIEKADAVVALTHIGYDPKTNPGDAELARRSRDIDVIIGGHSHDTIDPKTAEGFARSRVKNLDGREVLIVQTGKSGMRLGKIDIDLDSLGLKTPGYELLSVDSRLDGYKDPEIQAVIDRYYPGVDSLMHLWVARTKHPIAKESPELLNFFSDFILDKGRELAEGVDLAIANKGGLRNDLPEGNVSKGHIINMVPFRNFVTVLDVTGKDLQEAFDAMSKTDGNGVSRNVSARYDTLTQRCPVVLIDGKPIDPKKTYRLATIDYLAKGGDYMESLKRGKTVAVDPEPVYESLVSYLQRNKKPISGSKKLRMTQL